MVKLVMSYKNIQKKVAIRYLQVVPIMYHFLVLHVSFFAVLFFFLFVCLFIYLFIIIRWFTSNLILFAYLYLVELRPAVSLNRNVEIYILN